MEGRQGEAWMGPWTWTMNMNRIAASRRIEDCCPSQAATATGIRNGGGAVNRGGWCSRRRRVLPRSPSSVGNVFSIAGCVVLILAPRARQGRRGQATIWPCRAEGQTLIDDSCLTGPSPGSGWARFEPCKGFGVVAVGGRAEEGS